MSSDVPYQTASYAALVWFQLEANGLEARF
jgi:hypothetical protein